MAKLFASKFNLDQLPDPVKPSTTLVQASNIHIEPIEQKPLETQALNAQLRTVDSQKANISTSDEILARQGVRKSSSTQYVSSVKVEPFGTIPVNQGAVNIKKPKGVEDKTSNIVINSIKQGSIIVDPKVEIVKVEQGNKITNPNISTQKQLFEEKTTNPKIGIVKVDQKTKITDPKITIKQTQVGDRITDPNTIIKKTRVSEIINAPKIRIKEVKKDEFIVNPKVVINKVQDTSKITNPNIEIKQVKVGNRITDPNIEIKQVSAGDRITNPNTKIIRIQANELIVNPNTATKRVAADDRITNPNTVISKVNVGELITMPNIVLSQMKQTDVRSYQPDLTGNGNTKLFPRTINLEKRIKQALLGSTKHLPEYILSDQNTGFITITSPNVIAKVSAVKVQRIQYEKFILKQGGIEDILKGIISYVNPFKFGERKPKQGSVIIKNNQKFVNKTSPVEIKKLSTRTRVTDPKTVTNKIVPGSRTTDPKLRIDKNQKIQIIVDPQIQIELPKENVTRDPQTKITPPADIAALTTIPELKIKVLSKQSKIEIPKIKPAEPKKTAELLKIPNIKIEKANKPGTGVKNPRTQITKVKIGSRTYDPKIQPNIVKPGSRTTIPRLVLPLSDRTNNVKDPQVKIVLFEPTDSKLSGVQDVPMFGDVVYNTLAVFPIDDTSIPQNGQIVQNQQFDPYAVLPSNQSTATQLALTDGTQYSNHYANSSKYDYNNQDTPLKNAGAAPIPTLAVTYYDGSPITQQKQVITPLTTYGDPNTQGGYRTLKYEQMQQRAQRNNRRNLDYTYSEATPAQENDYWRTRLGMPDNGADTLNGSVGATKNDFVKIRIKGRGATLQFRSYLKAFSDSVSANYADVTYVGRPDVLKVFKNTTRQVTIGFLVPAFSKDDLKGIYSKLNKLVQIATTGTKNGTYVDGPFLSVTVGNWFVDTPAVANSIKFDTNPTEYSWDVNYEVPQIVDVSLDLSILSDNNGGVFLSGGTYINYGA